MKNNIHGSRYALSPAVPVAECGAPAPESSGFFFAGFVIRDGKGSASIRKNHGAALQTYFNDTFLLFLYILTRFALQATATEREKKKLRLLFDELIRTRELLEKEGQ